MAKTAKAKPTAKDTKTKKSTSRKRTVKGKSNANELLSSPTSHAPNEVLSSPKSRAERAAHRSALLTPTEVDNLALSAVNPSVSEINYDIVSPRLTCAQANGIGRDNYNKHSRFFR